MSEPQDNRKRFNHEDYMMILKLYFESYLRLTFVGIIFAI